MCVLQNGVESTRDTLSNVMCKGKYALIFDRNMAKYGKKFESR